MVNWRPVYNANVVGDKVSKLTTTIVHMLDKMAP
jgi:hypothetical protein